MYLGMLHCRIFSSLLWWADLLPLGEEAQDHVHHLPQEQSNSFLMTVTITQLARILHDQQSRQISVWVTLTDNDHHV